MSDPITHATIVAELERLVRAIRGSFDATSDNLLKGSPRRVAYAGMVTDFEGIGRDLQALRDNVSESAPPEPAGRPLEAIFADIRAQGHTCITAFTNIYNGKPYSKCNSHLPDPERADSAWTNQPYEEWATKVEHGEATEESDDIAAAAEARLAQIRELRGALVHFNPDIDRMKNRPACGLERAFGEPHTTAIDNVTCPACREWYGIAPCTVCGARLHRFAGTGEWCDSIGNPRSDTPEPHEHVPAIVGAEEARSAAAASERLENITDVDDGVIDVEEG